MAPVISLLEFSTTFGGTIALSLMGSVFNNRMSSSGLPFSISTATDSLQGIEGLDPELQRMVRDRAGTVVMWVMWAFVAVAPFMVSRF